MDRSHEFRPARFLAGCEGEGVSGTEGNPDDTLWCGAKDLPRPVLDLGCCTSNGSSPRSCLISIGRREQVLVLDLTEHDDFFKVMKTPLQARMTRPSRYHGSMRLFFFFSVPQSCIHTFIVVSCVCF